MTDAAELVVTVEPELPLVENDVVVKTDGKKETAVVAAKDPGDDLKAQYAELQAKDAARETARQDAERRATQAAQEAQRARQEAAQARSQVVDSELDTVTTGLDAAKTEASAAKAEYISAQEAGDYKRAADAQEKMSAAQARIVRLDEAKADIETRKAAKPDIETAASVDPFETYVSNRTEPTKNWLRDHREWVTDPRKNAKLTAAHYNAVGEGLSPDTPEYFENVETFIGLRKQEGEQPAVQVNGNGAAQPQTKRRASVPVAPVQASGGGTNGGGNEVRLSASEARAATDGTLTWNYDDPSPQKRFKKGDALGVQEFARRKKAMQEQGLYDRSFTEQ